MQINRRSLPFVAGMTSALATMPAMAQVSTASPAVAPAGVPGAMDDMRGIGDIVVTATRTGAAAAQKTPIAISVFSADQIATSGVTNIKDLVALTPNLNVSQTTASAQIYIRGIGSNNVFNGSDPDVTVQVDGVYLARAYSQFGDYIDVERVEVLRGPQGTLYGRNAVGGTINVTSRKPSDTFQSRVQLNLGNYSTVQAQGFVSGPIVPGTLQASITGSYIRHSSYVDNIVPGRSGQGNANRGGVRGQLRFTPSPAIEAITRGDFNKGNERFAGSSELLVAVPYAPLASSIVGDYFKTALNEDQRNRTKSGGVSEEINIRLSPALNLKSLTAYRYSHYAVNNDTDGTEIEVNHTLQSDTSRQYSQEFDLTANTSRFDGVAGLFLFHERELSNNTSITIPSVGTPAASAARSSVSPISIVYSYAGFAQGTFRLTPNIGLIAGLRYTIDRKHLIQDNVRTSLNPATLGAQLAGSPFAADVKRRYHALTPKFGVNWQLSNAVLAYASATRGFKSGGTNFSASNALTLSYGPEKIWSFEGGIKSDLLDRRLRVNLAVFRYKYTDLQVQAQIAPGVASITNAASATVKGIELETIAKPTSNLVLSASYSYLDARYDDFPNASVPAQVRPYVTTDPRYNAAQNTFDASGNRLNTASKHSVITSAQYNVPVGSGDAFLRGEYYWRSRAYYDASNFKLFSQGAFSLVNLAVGYTTADKRWGVSLLAKNVTDKQYLIIVVGNAAKAAGIPGAPRTVALQLTANW